MSDNNPSAPYPVTGSGGSGLPGAATTPPVSSGDGTPPNTAPGDSTAEGSSRSDTAKDQAANVAGSAKEQAASVAGTAADSAKDVAGTAREEAGHVASTAKKQAKDLYAETRSQLTEQAGAQQQRVASGLHSLSGELRDMSDASSGSGIAADLVSQAASRTGSVASWLEDRDPGSLLTEVTDFARRRPGTFIAVAAVAGIVAGRLTRSLVSEAKDSSADDRPATGSDSGAAAPATGATVPTAPDAAFAPPVPTTPVYGSAGSTTPGSAPTGTGAYGS